MVPSGCRQTLFGIFSYNTILVTAIIQGAQQVGYYNKVHIRFAAPQHNPEARRGYRTSNKNTFQCSPPSVIPAQAGIQYKLELIILIYDITKLNDNYVLQREL